jgi:glycosyl transferase family 25
MSHNIEKIFYINLDKREDRKAEIEAELQLYDLANKVERISAIHTPSFGILGCTMSHLNAIKLAKERNYKNVLILEDDYYFTISKEDFENQLSRFFDANIEYDICMISYNLIQSDKMDTYPFLLKVLEAQTASGYIINHHFYDTMIELYEWAIPIFSDCFVLRILEF